MKKPTTTRLSDQAIAFLQALTARTGLSQAAVIEAALSLMLTGESLERRRSRVIRAVWQEVQELEALADHDRPLTAEESHFRDVCYQLIEALPEPLKPKENETI